MMTPLRTAHDLMATQEDVEWLMALKAQERFWDARRIGSSAERRGNFEVVQCRHQFFVETDYELPRIVAQAVPDRRHETIGQLSIVQDRTTSCATAHEGQCRQTRIAFAITMALKVAQRESWLAPLVEADGDFSSCARGSQQGLIQGHVPRAAGGRVAD